MPGDTWALLLSFGMPIKAKTVKPANLKTGPRRCREAVKYLAIVICEVRARVQLQGDLVGRLSGCNQMGDGETEKGG